MLIGVQDEILRLEQLGLLAPLLKDQTTGHNIRWATDAYAELGRSYEKNAEITPDLITGEHSGVIRNRARKELELQSDRTKSHAEVFSPIWVCNRMIDAALEESHNDVQNASEFDAWIQSRWLEITCGEAPFLVQRYDVLTGEVIPIEQRKGILDRKLQSICTLKAYKDVGDFEGAQWIKSMIRAFQSVYGYELQGDNLLIARLNLYMTFEEYLDDICHRKPTPKESKQIIDIITWNLWQMNGLTGHTPCDEEPPSAQRSLFDWAGVCQKPKETPKPCQIRFYINSKSIKTFTISQLAEQGEDIMKFDYIVGNPPYQEETVQQISETNGQASRKNIFHMFQLSVDKIVNNCCVLIYPAIRWIHRSGKGMDKFGLSQINDQKLKKIIYYKNAKEVFRESDIADGISIVIKSNKSKNSDEFEFVSIENNNEFSIIKKYPGDRLLELDLMQETICNHINNIVKLNQFEYINKRIQPRTLFGIESNYISLNIDKTTIYDDSMTVDYKQKVKLLTNDKPGKAGRAKWFIVDKNEIKNQSLISNWKVVVSSANAGGQKRDNKLEIIDNHSAFGRSRVAIGLFETETEAKNFYAYLKTYLIRFMFLMTDENLTSLGKKVPDILDFTNNNKFVDFSKDLDAQLFKLFELSNEEIKYIKSTIDEIRKKRGEKAETHVKPMT